MGLIAQIIEGCADLLLSEDEARLKLLTKRTAQIKAMFPPADKWNEAITERSNELLSLADDAMKSVSSGDPARPKRWTSWRIGSTPTSSPNR